MKVICAGWGRTGTRSLKYALEHINGQPSYHMQNILLNKRDAKLWYDIIFNNPKTIKWDEIYNGFGACLDFPSCNYYKELMDAYPDAKVILTVREENGWMKSTSLILLGRLLLYPDLTQQRWSFIAVFIEEES